MSSGAQTAWLAAGYDGSGQTWAAVVVVEPIPSYLFICQCVCVWARKCVWMCMCAQAKKNDMLCLIWGILPKVSHNHTTLLLYKTESPFILLKCVLCKASLQYVGCFTVNNTHRLTTLAYTLKKPASLHGTILPDIHIYQSLSAILTLSSSKTFPKDKVRSPPPTSCGLSVKWNK